MKKIYKLKEFSRLINRNINTLQRWDRDGILIAHNFNKKQKILISYKDRFIRLGFDWFDKFLKSYFSCCIYGLRKYKKQKKKYKDRIKANK